MSNYLHGWKTVDAEEGKKYRISFPDSCKADAGAIKNWHIYTVKSLSHRKEYDWDSGMFRNTGEIKGIIFEEHPQTIYSYKTFSYYPIIESIQDIK